MKMTSYYKFVVTIRSGFYAYIFYHNPFLEKKEAAYIVTASSLN